MKKPLGFYDYTVVLTYCGMLSAVVGIFLALNGAFTGAMIALMTAGICDMFDGAVASTKKDRTAPEKTFGIQIDSLSDLISFGVMPGLFVYCISGGVIFGAVTASLFILAALIRLAYFNVLEEERQRNETGRRESYLGVPVTTIALLLPLLYIVRSFGLIGMSYVPFAVLLIAVACGFIAPFSMKKPHIVGKIIMIVMGVAELAALIIAA